MKKLLYVFFILALISCGRQARMVHQPGMTDGQMNPDAVIDSVKGVRFAMIEVKERNFMIGETEVTQALWCAVMGDELNKSEFRGADRPVEHVSWDDCQEFIRKLNELTGENYRLPTEEEWQYAAGGGEKGHGYAFSGSNVAEDVAWCESETGETHNVGEKRPNELGVYDMSGNVWEWCEDLYEEGSQDRVYRGGCWDSGAELCRVSVRNHYPPGVDEGFLGLRLAK